MAIRHYQVNWRASVTEDELKELSRVWPGRFTAAPAAEPTPAAPRPKLDGRIVPELEDTDQPAAAPTETKPAKRTGTKPARPE